MSRQNYFEEIEDLLDRRDRRGYSEERLMRLVVSVARAVAEEVVDIRLCDYDDKGRGFPMIRYRPDRGREGRGYPMIRYRPDRGREGRGYPMIRYRPDRGREERGQPMIRYRPDRDRTGPLADDIESQFLQSLTDLANLRGVEEIKDLFGKSIEELEGQTGNIQDDE